MGDIMSFGVVVTRELPSDIPRVLLLQESVGKSTAFEEAHVVKPSLVCGGALFLEGVAF